MRDAWRGPIKDIKGREDLQKSRHRNLNIGGKGDVRRITRTALICALLAAASGASANDSVARKAAGGIELVKTDRVQMVSEVLEISESRVRVTYHFLNTSDKDITTTVAFPMPTINWSDSDSNDKPLDSFHVFADGKRVAVENDRQLLVHGVNVADRLRKSGMSDDQIFQPTFKCMDWNIDGANANGCNLTEAQNKVIRSLYDAPDDDSVSGWKITETAYWKQTFPAGKDVEVVHEYRPLAGIRFSDASPEQSKDACLDHGTQNLISRRISDNPGYAIRDVEYILGTGRNWKGPIKSFRLILKKNHPNDVVSLCFPGKPTKTSSTTLEFVQKNYEPQDRLVVLFYDFHDDAGPRD